MEGGSAQYYYHFEMVTLDDVLGNIYLLAKDPRGCHFLIMKSAEGCPGDVEKIFVEIIDHIVELTTDPCGNHLVRKLLEVCTNCQKMRIIDEITRRPEDLVRFSFDSKGTWVVLKVIETLNTPDQFSLIASLLKPRILDLMNDSIGYRVALRCMQHLSPEYKEYLFEDAVTHCSRLAKDCNTCCVLQECLRHCDGELRRRLVCGITSDALNLSQHPYGNYVVQFVFDLKLPWATASLLDKLEGSYGHLSLQKSGSHVLEKCLWSVGEEGRPRIVQELISDCRFDQILQHQYGNYVILTALQYSTGDLCATLIEAIMAHAPSLRTSPYGKRILDILTNKPNQICNTNSEW